MAVLFEPKARLEMALVAAPPVIDLPREAGSSLTQRFRAFR